MAAALARVRHITGHRPSAVRGVVRPIRGRAWTVRSGVPVLKSANNSATVPLYRATMPARVNGGDVGDGGRGRVAEGQHVGQALPGVVDAAGDGDAALRMWTGGVEPGLVQAPGDDRFGFRCLLGCWWCVFGGGRGCRPAARLVLSLIH